jgi:hypothetical protein
MHWDYIDLSFLPDEKDVVQTLTLWLILDILIVMDNLGLFNLVCIMVIVKTYAVFAFVYLFTNIEKWQPIMP